MPYQIIDGYKNRSGIPPIINRNINITDYKYMLYVIFNAEETFEPGLQV